MRSNTVGAVTLNIYRAACTVSQECMLFNCFWESEQFDDGHVVSTVGQGDIYFSFFSATNHDRVKQTKCFLSIAGS